jgi:hypothetical protein
MPHGERPFEDGRVVCGAVVSPSAAAVARAPVKHRQALLTPKVLARLNELAGKGDGGAAALAAVEVIAAAPKGSQEAVATLIKEGSVELMLRLLTRSSSVPTQCACALGVHNAVAAGSMAQTKCALLYLVPPRKVSGLEKATHARLSVLTGSWCLTYTMH